MTEPAAMGKGPDREVSILVPGTFSYLHYGHFRFFQDCKSAFSRVKLTVGIHDSAQSFLSETEKVQTLSQVAGVDDVILHLPKVDRQLLLKHGIDYVALMTEFQPEVLEVTQILCLPGYPQVNTDQIAEQIYAHEEDFIVHILEDKLEAWECGMTRMQLHMQQVRLYVRRKLARWNGVYPEDVRSQHCFRLLLKATERKLRHLVTSDLPSSYP